MTYAIIVTAEAIGELTAIKASNSRSHAACLVLLQQLDEDKTLLDDLNRPHIDNNGDPIFEVKRFAHAQNNGYNLYILKYHLMERILAHHRIIYAFSPLEGKYYVLSIIHRSVDYDRDPNWYQEVCRRYDDLGIPKLVCRI